MVRPSGIVVGDRLRGADVRLGRPVEVPEFGLGPERAEPPQRGDREDLAREQHEPRGGGARAVEPAVLGEQGQDRRGRVPDAQPPLGQERPEPRRVLAQRLADQDQGRRGAARGEEVEDRQVEVERGVRGEPVVGGRSTNVRAHQSRNVKAFACESMTPLGWPVEPEV